MYDETVRDEKNCIEEVFMTFLDSDSEIVGQLIWRLGQFVFEGNMAASASTLFDGCLRQIVDAHISDILCR